MGTYKFSRIYNCGRTSWSGGSLNLPKCRWAHLKWKFDHETMENKNNQPAGWQQGATTKINARRLHHLKVQGWHLEAVSVLGG